MVLLGSSSILIPALPESQSVWLQGQLSALESLPWLEFLQSEEGAGDELFLRGTSPEQLTGVEAE